MKQDRSEAGKSEIKSARTVLIKAMIFSFYQYRSGCVFYCSRIARKVEAGLCLLVNVGKRLHGEVNDGSAASAYQSVPGTDRENVVYRDQAGDAGGEACGNKNLRIQPHI